MYYGGSMEKLTPKEALAIVLRHTDEHSTCGPNCYPEVTPAVQTLVASGYEPHSSSQARHLVEQNACAD